MHYLIEPSEKTLQPAKGLLGNHPGAAVPEVDIVSISGETMTWIWTDHPCLNQHLPQSMVMITKLMSMSDVHKAR